MRTEGDFIHINEWLLPLSWFYGLGVGIRNQLFNIGLLKQHDYDIPIISVGNITVGGSFCHGATSEKAMAMCWPTTSRQCRT